MCVEVGYGLCRQPQNVSQMADAWYVAIHSDRTGNPCRGETISVKQVGPRLAHEICKVIAQSIERESLAEFIVRGPGQLPNAPSSQFIGQRAARRRCDQNFEAICGDRWQRGKHRALAAQERWIFTEDQ